MESKGKIIAFSVIVVLVFGVLIYAKLGNNDKLSGLFSKDKEAAEENIQYQQTTIEDLYKELNANPSATAQKYDHQFIDVSGYVISINKDGKSFLVAKANDSQLSLESISCSGKKAQEVIASGLTIGQRVNVKGKVLDVGEVLGYSMKLYEIINY